MVKTTKGFLIHGSHPNNNMNRSNGCIILNRGIRNQIGNSVDGGDNQLKVIE